MRIDKPLITGTIKQEGVTASFVCSDYKFVFLPGEHDFKMAAFDELNEA